jgi:MFS superfamily sulfate permease-like transporter
MITMERSVIQQILRYDIPSSVAVFFVSLPLCMGIALASGAPLFSGIIAGMIGGIVVGSLSNSQISVSGPAAGLTVVVASSIHTLGGFEFFLTSLLVAGSIQILMGSSRLGIIANYFPVSVIKGMLAAIGMVIVLKQIPHALGRDKDYEGDLSFWGVGGSDTTFGEILNALHDVHPIALLITVVSLIILLIGELRFIRQNRLFSFIPGALLVVIASVTINEVVRYVSPELYLGIKKEHLINIPVANSFSEFLSFFRFPKLSNLFDQNVYVIAALIAVISSAETLFSLEAADKLDPQKRISSPNRELIAQGVGNMLAGLLGGIPISAVIVRTSANAYSGARTRYSAIFHGFLILITVAMIPEILSRVPLASLSAILFMVGYRLTNVKIFMEMYRAGVEQFVPFIVTIIAIIFTDLLTGLLIGMVVGFFFVIKNTHYNAFTLVSIDNYYLLRFNKDITFINKSELKEKLSSIPSNTYLIIDGSKALIIDADVYDILTDYLESAIYKNITIELKNCDTKKVKFQVSTSG